MMNKRAMIESWILEKSYKMSRSESLRQGWLISRNSWKMRDGVSEFEFLKTDGTTIRHALGTLNPMVIPPIKGIKSTPKTQQVFFDIEKQEWRSYRKTNLLKVY